MERLIAACREKRAELQRQKSDLNDMLKELAQAEKKCREALAECLNGENSL